MSGEVVCEPLGVYALEVAGIVVITCNGSLALTAFD
jgi:hypothetical protein